MRPPWIRNSPSASSAVTVWTIPVAASTSIVHGVPTVTHGESAESHSTVVTVTAPTPVRATARGG